MRDHGRIQNKSAIQETNDVEHKMREFEGVKTAISVTHDKQ